MMINIEIIKKRSSGKFYIPLNGKEAHLLYRFKNEDTIEYYSTFVPPEYRGKSYAEELVTFGLDYARKNNLKVIATCPYVKNFVKNNQEKLKDFKFDK